MDLRAVELGQELRGREMLRLLLQAHIDGRGDGDVGAAIAVRGKTEEHEGVRLHTHKRLHTREMVTIFGQVSVTRVGYRAEGEACIHPLDQQLQLPRRRYSYEVQRRLTKNAVQGPFDEAIEALQALCGVKMPKRMAEIIVIDASADFDSFYRLRTGRAQSGPLLVGAIDCKGIPMVKSELASKTVRRRKGQKAQKKRMATVATVFEQGPRIRTPEDVIESLFDPDKTRVPHKAKTNQPQGKRVWASLKAGKELFIGDVSKEMDRRDPRSEKLRVVLTDGERALQIRVCRIMKGVILILDLLHVLEKLWDVGHTLYGEGSDKAEKFVRERALRILRGQVSQVVKGLRQIVTKRKLNGSRKKKLLNVANYFYTNRPRMCYDAYLAHGLPIASGSVEGACKNLIKDRMERSGMRWSANMAEAMVKMRATYLSGDFDEYWDYHVREDQKRLHPDKCWKPVSAVVLK